MKLKAEVLADIMRPQKAIGQKTLRMLTVEVQATVSVPQRIVFHEQRINP